ncbi:MAG: glutamine-hydrolyzing GMP synthase, partial [Patescibacteria group bacterium]|nr:glutamine-hydrolyzing GMP synthase [Patescibacteria group bacterium]
GHQITMKTLGGQVQKGTVGEYGLTTFEVKKSEGIFAKLRAQKYQVYASHFDTVAEVPEGFEVTGETPDDKLSATQNLSKKIYTIQFHPEVTHTECGMQILDSFIEITGAKRDWSIEKFIEREINAIKDKVGDKKVFMLVSGGVDSSVAYVLLEKALGSENIYAMYVDTGFMRQNETEEIKKFLDQAGAKDLHVYDAKDEYFDALKEVYHPEEKRKIIGDLFLKIQKKVAKDLNLNPEEWLLGQGTIYPDTIESGGTKNADKIKTHHNRVPEIEEMIRKGLIIEPLKELYKDEVRMVGRKLGLPDEMVDRHPFPGPGLAVRCLCLDKEAPAPKVEGLEGTVLPLKSVGVQGDERTYRHPVILEGQHDWDELRELSPKITNKFSEINRVLFSIMDEKINSVSITPGYLTKARIATLQKADKLVMDFLREIDKEDKVWQCPTVLLPISVNSEGEESIVIRPVSSEEAMTANFTELPWDGVQNLAKQILALPGISAVFYDITNKPPGTIEWE